MGLSALVSDESPAAVVGELGHQREHGFEAFILRDGGIFPLLLWGGYVVLGSVLPMALLFNPRWPQHAAVALGAEAFYPPQYERGGPKIWPPALQQKNMF